MNMKTKDPDDLLKDMNHSIMIKGLIIATTIHAVIILGTSFGLYSDWNNPTYRELNNNRNLFFAAPSTINQLKQKERRLAEEVDRAAAAAERAAEQEAKAQAAATNKTSTARQPAATSSSRSGNDDLDGPATPMRDFDKEVLPPAGSFDLNDFGGI